MVCHASSTSPHVGMPLRQAGMPVRQIQRRLSRPTRRVVTRVEASAALVQALHPYMPSLMGGLTLGVLVVGKLLISGNVLGISGAVRGIVEGDRTPWRVLFVSGLLVGGILLKFLLPTAFGVGLGNLPMARVALAGVLVGVGTSLGNGCTSGHGICGNARLSVRSFISTVTFMVFGALAASVLGTAGMEGVTQHGLVTAVEPDMNVMKLASAVLGGAIAFVTTIASIAYAIKSKKEEADRDGKIALFLDDVAEFGIGLLFALGLGVSGMTQPEKVTGFLSFLTGTWDPSLIFVMGGALLVALPGYQFVLRTNYLHEPLCCTAFTLPTTQRISLKLIIGSALFGLGWGAAGICPGPGMVSLASLQAGNMAFVGSMLIGMALTKTYQRMVGVDG